MADKTIGQGGEIVNAGRIKLILNPPKAAEEGVTYTGHWIRAELDDEGNFTVRLFGSAKYGDRSLSDHLELTDPGLEPIKEMLEQVLEAYGPHAKTNAMSSAYTARKFALDQGESLTSK